MTVWGRGQGRQKENEREGSVKINYMANWMNISQIIKLVLSI